MRTATPLNISEQPGTGLAYVIRDLKTNTLVRCATAAHRDLSRKGSKIKALRAFSGDEPYFIAKIGSLRTKFTVLKFLCGAHHKKCLDETGRYEWTGITLAEAKKKHLEFETPGRVAKEDEEEEQPQLQMRGAAKIDPRTIKFPEKSNLLKGLRGSKMRMFAVVFVSDPKGLKNQDD
jgi:hypothetical protein